MTVETRTIEEELVNDRRLGRHVAHDPRSRDFPADAASTLKSVKHQATGLPLDQGNWGSCTANALAGALNSAPDFKGNILTEADAFALYQQETALEGYTTPPDDPGGTGLYVCRAAKHAGLVRSYRHAFGIDHALHALVLRPVIFGIDWYSSFDEPDKAGLVVLADGAYIRGGHEIVADELDVGAKLIGLWNSWGSEWGLGGRFYMGWSTMARLLEAQGDCVAPYV